MIWSCAQVNRPEYFLGLDLGQASDWSALAILERSARPIAETPQGKGVWSCACRGLKRWPLGTPYTAIVDDMAKLVQKPPLRHARLIIDATGVGRPVVDMFVKSRLPVKIVPAMITAGNKESYQDSFYHVAKVVLISTVVVHLQERRLRFARALPETPTLIKELQNYRVKVTPAANETFSAREGEHDDLVLALALALWDADRQPPKIQQFPTLLVPGKFDMISHGLYRS